MPRRSPRTLGTGLLIALLVAVTGAQTAQAAPDNDNDNRWGAHVERDSIVIHGSDGTRLSSPGTGIVGPFLDVNSATGVTWAVDRPPSVPTGCVGQLVSGQWVQDVCPLVGPTPDPRETSDPDWQPPSTAEIIVQGLAATRVDLAGLVVQPSARSYVGVPTLVHAATTSQDLAVQVLGREVDIHVRAEGFAFDFGDGSAALVTRSPGAPYPDRTNRHTYLEPSPSRVVTLTTTWSATATNPFTGETLTIDGVIATTEQSAPFDVRRSTTALTDLAEQQAGH